MIFYYLYKIELLLRKIELLLYKKYKTKKI